MKPLGRQAVVAHQCVERTVLAANDAGLDVAAAEQRRAGVPGLTPVIRDGHQRAIEAVRIQRDDQPLVVGDLSVAIHQRTVTRGGASVHLTPTEWSLLIVLATNPGRTMTHDQLFHAVWGNSYGQPQQYLRVYITHLRKKIEVEPYAPRFIVTEPGVGYRFEVDRVAE